MSNLILVDNDKNVSITKDYLELNYNNKSQDYVLLSQKISSTGSASLTIDQIDCGKFQAHTGALIITQTGTNINYDNMKFTTCSGTTFYGNLVDTTTVFGATGSITNLIVSSTGTLSNLVAGTGTISNATISSLSCSTGSITNLTVSSTGTLSNLVAGTGTITKATVSSLSCATGTITNLTAPTINGITTFSMTGDNAIRFSSTSDAVWGSTYGGINVSGGATIQKSLVINTTTDATGTIGSIYTQGGINCAKRLIVKNTAQLQDLTFTTLNGENTDLSNHIKIGSNFSQLQGTISLSENWNDLAFSENGRYMLLTSNLRIFKSTDHGKSFVEKTPLSSQNYSSCKVSSSGTYMTVCSTGASGCIFYSSDFGTTWTHTGLYQNYLWNDMSDDGIYQAVVSSTGVYISTNSGISWTNTKNDFSQINYLLVSQSGQYIYINDYNAGLYLSSDFGSNFSLVKNAGAQRYAAVSKDGRYSIAQERLNGFTYWSTDYGQTYGSAGVKPTIFSNTPHPSTWVNLDPPEQFDGSSNWMRVFTSDTQTTQTFQFVGMDGSYYANPNFCFKNMSSNSRGTILAGINNADGKIYICYGETINNYFTENSVSTISGALQIPNGGLGIGKSVYGGMTGSFDTVISRSVQDAISSATGSMIALGGLSVNKNIFCGSGIYLSTNGGVPANLNFYEEHNNSYTLSGPFLTNPSGTFSFTRIGKIVNLQIPSIYQLGKASGYDIIQTTTQIPIRFTPSSTRTTYVSVINQGITTSGEMVIGTDSYVVIGLLTANTGTGILSSAGFYPGSGSLNGVNGCNITYAV